MAHMIDTTTGRAAILHTLARHHGISWGSN